MRAIGILQEKLGDALDFMHTKQRAAFWRATVGLVSGHRLWLTALGRSLPGECTDKHRIKAIDRLIGSATVQGLVPMLYAALAGYLLAGIQRPVILVDWTGAEPGLCVLSAKLCFQGRALTIFSRTFPVKRKCSPPAEREFLAVLATIIPARCKPVLVTDAGFLFKWFDAVRSLGWDFIGRVRGQLTVRLNQGWVTLPEVHALATRRPRDLGRLLVSKKDPQEFRVVLSAKPKPKGRHKLGRAGAPRQSTADHQRRAAAREPWVLVTSLADPARVVIDAYHMRMQIEETFRDLKSHRYGWSVEDIRSKNPRRVDVLLLIGAFGAVAMHLVGLAAGAKNLQRQFQANTERRRAVFSTFFLAKLILTQRKEPQLPMSLLRDAAVRLRCLLSAVSLEELAA